MAGYRDWFVDKDYAVGQDVNSMTPRQIEDAIGVFSSHGDAKSRGAFNWLQQLQAKHYANQDADRMAEYQGAMLEAYEKMAEASAYQAPYQQPTSKAAAAYGEAQADTQNRQLMRRGLISLTRWGNGGSSGKRTTLGVA